MTKDLQGNQDPHEQPSEPKAPSEAMVASGLMRQFYRRGKDKLKGYYFDCSSYKQADKYCHHHQTINEYIEKAFTNSGDIRVTLVACCSIAQVSQDEKMSSRHIILTACPTNKLANMSPQPKSSMNILTRPTPIVVT